MTTQGRTAQRRTMQEATTSLGPEQALDAARTFFSRRVSIYASFIDMEGPGWVSFRGQGGEEVVVAARAIEGGSRVTGSTYLFDMQVARFLSTLPPLDADATAPVVQAAGATGAA
ncbi:MAG TPA: hypothetical protein VFZ11_10390 [Gemmatimonadaceae bacterium]